MNKILLIDTAPFGMLVDIYKWAIHLSDEYEVNVICFKSKDDIQVKHDGINLIEVDNYSSRILKAVAFFCVCIYHLLKTNCIVIIEYFDFCEILKILFPKKKILLDIRTLSVVPDNFIRQQKNKKIVRATKVFKDITVISDGIAKEIDCKNAKILPLGSDVISNMPKNYVDSMNLLYVGTFTGREIHKTVAAVATFMEMHKDIPIKYKIVGFGTEEDILRINNIIRETGTSNNIQLIGKVPHDQLTEYFDNANIGISFVPLTDYYQYQPPTKTYEYSLSGLVTIATNTISNQMLINESNGILIEDSVSDIIMALECYWNNRNRFSEVAIRRSLEDSTWYNIVNNQLKVIIRSL